MIEYKTLIQRASSKLSKANLDHQKITDYFWSNYHYLKGLNYYLKAENKTLDIEESFQLVLGKTGAATQFYLAGLKYGENKWSIKAKKLYERIQKNSYLRFGKKIKDYKEFGSGKEKAPVKK